MGEVEIGLASIETGAGGVRDGKGVPSAVGAVEPHVMVRPRPVGEVDGAAARNRAVLEEVSFRYVGDGLCGRLSLHRGAEKSAQQAGGASFDRR